MAINIGSVVHRCQSQYLWTCRSAITHIYIQDRIKEKGTALSVLWSRKQKHNLNPHLTSAYISYKLYYMITPSCKEGLESVFSASPVSLKRAMGDN